MTKNNMTKKQSVVIYGNSMESWAIAAGLGASFSHNIAQGLTSITIIAPELNHTPTGALTGSYKDQGFFDFIGLSEKQILTQCNATFSFGSQYCLKNKPQLFCFGDYGYAINGIGFQHLWTKYCQTVTHTSFGQFSFAAQCALENTFAHPQASKQSIFSSLNYAINIDEAQFTKILKSLALSQGVLHTSRPIDAIECGVDKTHINSLTLSDGSILSADVFIDSSKSRLLFNQDATVNEARATITHLTVQKETTKTSGAFTLEHMGLSWLKTVALPSKTTHTFIHNENESTDNINAFINNFSEEVLTSQYINTPIKTLWKGNIIAMGAAACPPAEFTISRIDLIHKQLKALLPLLPTPDDEAMCAAEYNQVASVLTQRVRDIQNIHAAVQKNELTVDSINPTLSPELAHFIMLFKTQGRVAFSEGALLSNAEWAALLICLNVTPETYDPLLDKYDFEPIKNRMDNAVKIIRKTIQQMPSCKDYLARYLMEGEKDKA